VLQVSSLTWTRAMRSRGATTGFTRGIGACAARARFS
jgi:hypothetical protein